jgi:D-galacturonate reductase
VKDKFPNGKEGYLWTDARVVWENGACLNVQNALGFPDAAPGSNTQGITMYCAGGGNGALIRHSDTYRGLEYSYTRNPGGPGATQYHEPSPDYFQYVDLGGPGLVPVGYGYRSVEFIVSTWLRIEGECRDVQSRRERLRELDETGVLATPANSRYNDLVVEAGRLSLANEGRLVRIAYEPAPGTVALA